MTTMTITQPTNDHARAFDTRRIIAIAVLVLAMFALAATPADRLTPHALRAQQADAGWWDSVRNTASAVGSAVAFGGSLFGAVEATAYSLGTWPTKSAVGGAATATAAAPVGAAVFVGGTAYSLWNSAWNSNWADPINVSRAERACCG